LLVETGQTAVHDRNLVVDAPEALQIERMRARDRLSPEQARRVLTSQAGRWQRLSNAHDVVTNGDPVEAVTSVAPQVASLDRKYRLVGGRAS